MLTPQTDRQIGQGKATMNEQKHRVALFQPWEKIDAGDRWLGLETADEIIFCDKSAVVGQLSVSFSNSTGRGRLPLAQGRFF